MAVIAMAVFCTPCSRFFALTPISSIADSSPRSRSPSGTEGVVTDACASSAWEINVDGSGALAGGVVGRANAPCGKAQKSIVPQDSCAATRMARRRARPVRSEEHTSELQSLMRISYAVFCLKKKNNQKNTPLVKDNQNKTIS